MVICSRFFSLNSVMDSQVLYFMLPTHVFHRVGAQLSDVKIHLLIYFSSTLAFAALKDRVKLPV